MSLFPIALDGEGISVVVVGGGDVGTRKALALAAAGARVRVISPDFSAELERAGAGNNNVTLERAQYTAGAVGVAHLVVAATDSAATNRAIAAEARERGMLVNVVDAPGEGNFQTMATHRSGELVIAVSAGRVPGAARRIRDDIASRFDERYARAVSALGTLRTVSRGSDGNAWNEASSALLGEDFCASVENGSFEKRVVAWG
ncbi:MAG TPA: NAD(P)-dependent oxidoreductase [Gemmatimonadaceae bacterium]|nr:NAD(P)-dependent oxidoreductase [Gemmatimonadaceae bacterium]